MGAAVGFAVGAAVGRDVGRGPIVRSGVGVEEPVGFVGRGVAAGVVGVGVARGTTAMPVGLALGDADVDVDGDGEATAGDELGPIDGAETDGVAVGGFAVGVGTAATGPVGWAEAMARSRSSTPPIPRAIVARTRFSTPRLRMSRAR